MPAVPISERRTLPRSAVTLCLKRVSKVHIVAHGGWCKYRHINSYAAVSRVQNRIRIRMRRVFILVTALLASVPLRATTLQRLSLEEMTQQSTAIVRAKVTGSSPALRGNEVWTFYQLQILETLKGRETNQIQVAVPGGAAAGLRQIVAGAPALRSGAEYVLFLWTGRSGLTQVIGLSQGLLSVSRDQQGRVSLVRPASKEIMLGSDLKPVTDPGLRLGWNEFRGRVRAQIGAGK